MKNYFAFILLFFIFLSCNQSNTKTNNKNEALEPVSDKYIEPTKKSADLEDIIPDAENVSYKLDPEFNGEEYDGIIYLAVFKNNNICTLSKSGIVSIVEPTGKLLNSFLIEVKNGKPTAIIVDDFDNINVFISLTKTEVNKVRGKIHNIVKPTGVGCLVYNVDGRQTYRYKLTNLLAASGARLSGSSLVISDGIQEAVGVFDFESKKIKSFIPGFRACRGVLDICINNKEEILVANNAVFHLKAFNFKGDDLYTLGGRGKTINDFRGCCNPMSVDCFSNGAIATIEKDPSRIKIYSKHGAKLISGTDEIIHGYKYLPMIIDHKDLLYFAVPDKGLFRCIPE